MKRFGGDNMRTNTKRMLKESYRQRNRGKPRSLRGGNLKSRKKLKQALRLRRNKTQTELRMLILLYVTIKIMPEAE